MAPVPRPPTAGTSVRPKPVGSSELAAADSTRRRPSTARVPTKPAARATSPQKADRSGPSFVGQKHRSRSPTSRTRVAGDKEVDNLRAHLRVNMLSWRQSATSRRPSPRTSSPEEKRRAAKIADSMRVKAAPVPVVTTFGTAVSLGGRHLSPGVGDYDTTAAGDTLLRGTTIGSGRRFSLNLADASPGVGKYDVESSRPSTARTAGSARIATSRAVQRLVGGKLMYVTAGSNTDRGPGVGDYNTSPSNWTRYTRIPRSARFSRDHSDDVPGVGKYDLQAHGTIDTQHGNAFNRASRGGEADVLSGGVVLRGRQGMAGPGVGQYSPRTSALSTSPGRKCATFGKAPLHPKSGGPSTGDIGSGAYDTDRTSIAYTMEHGGRQSFPRGPKDNTALVGGKIVYMSTATINGQGTPGVGVYNAKKGFVEELAARNARHRSPDKRSQSPTKASRYSGSSTADAEAAGGSAGLPFSSFGGRSFNIYFQASTTHRAKRLSSPERVRDEEH